MSGMFFWNTLYTYSNKGCLTRTAYLSLPFCLQWYKGLITQGGLLQCEQMNNIVDLRHAQWHGLVFDELTNGQAARAHTAHWSLVDAYVSVVAYHRRH